VQKAKEGTGRVVLWRELGITVFTYQQALGLVEVTRPLELLHARSFAMRSRHRTKVLSALLFSVSIPFWICIFILLAEMRYSSCCHFNISHYLHLGFCFCDAILDFWDPDQVLTSPLLPTSLRPSPPRQKSAAARIPFAHFHVFPFRCRIR
jgi:hypothetical protein